MLRRGEHCLSWSPASEMSFQELKERFTTAPILHHPDPEREFIVEADASSTGNLPKLFPCAYYSWKLKSAGQNYDVGNRELLAMKAAFEQLQHWLEGSKYPFLVL